MSRNSEDASKAWREAFKIMGEPIELYSDEETAFLAGVKNIWTDWGQYKTTKTHATIVERLMPTIKKGVADRIRFTKGNWTGLI